MAHLADAQTKKIPRVGFLIAKARLLSHSGWKAFKRGLRELGYIEGKNILSRFDLVRASPSNFLVLSAELVSLKVDSHCLWGSDINSRQTSDKHDTHCHDASRAIQLADGWSLASRDQGEIITGFVDSRSGAERKTTGASERNCSQPRPRGRVLFN